MISKYEAISAMPGLQGHLRFVWNALPRLDCAAARLHTRGSLVPVQLLAHFAAFLRFERQGGRGASQQARSEEHTSELQSLMRISYAVFCLKKKIIILYTTLVIQLLLKP